MRTKAEVNEATREVTVMIWPDAPLSDVLMTDSLWLALAIAVAPGKGALQQAGAFHLRAEESHFGEAYSCRRFVWSE